MSRATRLPAWLTPPPVDVAVEITSRRVTVAEVSAGEGAVVVSAFGSEALPPDAVTPAFVGPNVVKPEAVVIAMRQAFERAGVKPPRRVALVVPDSLARVSLVAFEQVPDKPADLDQLVRWQVKKATPFPIEDAQVSYVVAHAEPGSTTFAVTVARRDVITQYEAIAGALGMHAGLVDLSSFNLINAVLAAPAPPTGDWLLVSISAESTTLAILRGRALMFYRHRTAMEDEPLSALVHQTAMYHEDRMGGSAFSRVMLSSAALGPAGADGARREISLRLGVSADHVETRATAGLRERLAGMPGMLDALAAPVGLLLRERAVA
jgi:type IV pilus assembly protein PilM